MERDAAFLLSPLGAEAPEPDLAGSWLTDVEQVLPWPV
jgi:hypothetical protein